MSAHRFCKDWLAAPFKVSDPGASGSINLENKGRAVVPITTATSESRTLPAPEVAGQVVLVYLDTDGGNATITITGGQGISSVVLDDAGDAFELTSITVAGTAKWVPSWSSGPLSGFPQVMGGNVTVEGTLEVVGTATFDGAQTLTGNTTSTGAITTTRGVSSGTANKVGGLAYSNTAASTTVGGTSAETLFDVNYTLPANSLAAGTTLQIRYEGFGVAGIGTDTFAHKLFIGGSGGTNLINSAAAQLATNSLFSGEFELVCRTAGATGTVVGYGTYKQSSAIGTMTVKDSVLNSATINTTANQAIVVTGTWNTTNANSARLDILRVRIEG